MSYDKGSEYLSVTASSDTAPPTYTTGNTRTELQIFARRTEYVISPKDQHVVPGSASVVNRYTVEHASDGTVISNSEKSSYFLIRFSVNSGAVHFQIYGPGGPLAKFEVPEANIPKFHYTNFNLLFKDISPLRLWLLSNTGLKGYVWRPKVFNSETVQAPTGSEREIVGLVLLDKDYREIANFISHFDSVNESDAQGYLCGTLLFEQLEDDSFRQQAILSLIALIEVYRQSVQKSDKWNEKTDKVFGAALLCHVM